MTPQELNFIKDAFSQIIDDIAGNPDWSEAARAVASDLGTLERELGKKVVSLPTNLDEAAEKAGWEWACENKLDPYSMGQAYSEGHKAGAKWMAEQGETYKGGILRNLDGKLAAKAELKADSMFKYSEDVILQVRKKES